MVTMQKKTEKRKFHINKSTWLNQGHALNVKMINKIKRKRARSQILSSFVPFKDVKVDLKVVFDLFSPFQ